MEHGSATTQVTCTACGKPANVPFTPTPGRPVYCRDCFNQRRPPTPGQRGPPMRSGGGGGGGGGYFRDVNARKRMLAQGRKGHFMYDAKEVMANSAGGMDEQHRRAFLEGLFARGARDSTEAAQIFLDEKFEDKTITAEERDGLGRLLERYSFRR